MNITPVIMAGGSGTRLWPLSRKAEPKQFQSLISERSMLEETLARVSGDAFGPAVIIGSAQHLCVIEEQLTEPNGRIVLEPFGRNTGPAAIVSALLAAEDDPEALVLLLPADHHIADPEGFAEAVARGVPAANKGHLVTLGITPDKPETGYGYIRRGAPLGEGTYAVEAFIEKPDLPTAERYLSEGGYAWNAGIFLFRARDLLAEAEIHAEDMLLATRAAFDHAPREGRVISLPESDFAQVPSDSIDYAIMEKTSQAAVVSPVTIGWNDIGSWAAVKAFAESSDGGKVAAIDCRDSLIRTGPDGPYVAAIGLEGMVVVATGDTVLIARADRSQDVKKVVERLKEQGRDDLL